MGVVAILALAALFVFGFGKMGPQGGSVDVDMDKKTISWKSFERKEDLFAELNKLQAEKPEFLAVWLRAKGYLKTDDTSALRESGFFKSDDPQLITRFQENCPLCGFRRIRMPFSRTSEKAWILRQMTSSLRD
ncbi:hypothetical protein [Parasphingorhabdus sp.]|uniref:hypothetical protein n=1 Tax=Parasphingorhabdus sp. TaxID=2709688 RepID=UPI0030010526